MRGGIDSALLGLGVGALAELGREELYVPDDFERVR